MSREPPRSTGQRRIFYACALAVVGSACGGSNGPTYTSLLPLDYKASYVQVRPCRSSPDHDLNNTLVFADPLSAPTYMTRPGGSDAAMLLDQFPVGSLVVKEEYDINDKACAGPIVMWTVMSQLAPHSSPKTIDWQWQWIDAQHKVISQDEKRCINCHADCGGPPYGYSGTCSAPVGP